MVEIAAEGTSEDLVENVYSLRRVLQGLTNTIQRNPVIAPDISKAEWVTTARTLARLCYVQKEAYFENDRKQKIMAAAALSRE